jgi:hypothetical protein
VGTGSQEWAIIYRFILNASYFAQQSVTDAEAAFCAGHLFNGAAHALVTGQLHGW